MLSGLTNLIPDSFKQSLRRVLVVASIVAVIGIAGIGSGRTLEQKLARQDSAPQSALHSHSQSETVELIHDIQPQIEQPTVRTIMMEVTAYCACKKCCGPNAMGITASGLHVSYNAGKFVAADTSLLPFGTKLLIPGYDEAPVEVIDRGGAIKGNKLDVFFASHQRALEWGRQTIPVTVME